MRSRSITPITTRDAFALSPDGVRARVADDRRLRLSRRSHPWNRAGHLDASGRHEWQRLSAARRRHAGRNDVLAPPARGLQGLPQSPAAEDRRARRPAGRSLALLGFDQMMAEVLVDLITGAILPDSGEVIAFGEADVVDRRSRRDGWRRSISLGCSRIALCSSSSSRSNRTWHFRFRSRSKRCRRDVRARVAELATEVGLANDRRQAGVLAAGRVRASVSVARLRSHRRSWSLSIRTPRSAERRIGVAADIARIVETRGIASIVLTADQAFARAVAKEVLVLEPATGALKPASAWRRWFS